jgi:hypothetical protein
MGLDGELHLLDHKFICEGLKKCLFVIKAPALDVKCANTIHSIEYSRLGHVVYILHGISWHIVLPPNA